MDAVMVICALACAFAVYFLPTVIALHRGHPNTVPILLVNIFLGWSGIGWLAGLIWSTTHIAKASARAAPETRHFTDKWRP